MPKQVRQNVKKIVASLGLEPNGKVQRFFTNACYKHMDKYIPKDNGDLRTNVTIDANSITYESLYASYQYYGVREDDTHVVNPDNYTTPGTGPYWDEQMWTAERDEIVKEIEDYMSRGGRE